MSIRYSFENVWESHRGIVWVRVRWRKGKRMIDLKSEIMVE